MTRKNVTMWRALSMAALALLGGATGCKNFFTPVNGTGSGTPVVNTGNYAYAVNTVAETLSGFSISSTGTLTALSGFPMSLGFVPTSVAVSGTNAFLYVAGAGVLYGYAIASDGTLTPIKSTTGSYALVNVNIASMDTSPDGNWLIALDAETAIPTIDYYGINTSTGQLSIPPAVQYTLTSGATVVPSSIRVSPKGDYVAMALGTGGDVMFSFDTSATSGNFSLPVEVDTGSVSAADQALAFDSASSTLYIVRSGTGQGVYPWTISSPNGNSTLTQVAGAPFLLGPSTTTSGSPVAYGPASMVLDATGTYLYVGNRTASSISGFSIASGGVLAPLTGSPFTAGTTVDALARDNSKKYVLSTNLNGNPADISLYNFDATTAGKLDVLSTASTGDTAEPAGAVAIALAH